MKKETMTIARALRYKNTLVQKINDLGRKIESHNNFSNETPMVYDAQKLFIERNNVIEILIKLKTRISEFNQQIQEKIFRMSENKTTIAVLENLSPNFGSIIHQDRTIIYKSSIDVTFRDSRINSLRQENDRLQDEIDNYNARTKFDVDVLD